MNPPIFAFVSPDTCFIGTTDVAVLIRTKRKSSFAAERLCIGESTASMLAARATPTATATASLTKPTNGSAVTDSSILRKMDATTWQR